MKCIYSPRAVRDLESIASYYRSVADPKIANAMGDRIKSLISSLLENPESAPRVPSRPNVRAVFVSRFPFKIFYRLKGATIEILHIRHTGRRPWATEGE